MYVYQPFPEERVRVTVFRYVGAAAIEASGDGGGGGLTESLSGSISASRRAWIRDGGVHVVVPSGVKYAEFCGLVREKLGVDTIAAVLTEQGEPLVEDAFELFANQVLFVVAGEDELPELDESDATDALQESGPEELLSTALHTSDASARDQRFNSSRDSFRTSFSDQYAFGDVAKLKTIELHAKEQSAEIAALQEALSGDLIVGNSCPKRFLVYVRHKDVPTLYVSLSVVFPPEYPTVAPIVTPHVGNAEIFLQKQIDIAALSARINTAMSSSAPDAGRIFELYSVSMQFLHECVSEQEMEVLRKQLERGDTRRAALSMRHIFRNWAYSSVSAQNIMVLRSRNTQKVGAALGIAPPQANALLRSQNWKVSDIMRKVRTLGPEEASRHFCLGEASDDAWYAECSAADEKECTICYDVLPLGEMSALHCGHWFDNECYRGYLESKIKDGETDEITCPDKDCSIIVDEATIASLVDEDLFSKYMRFMLGNFVKKHPQLRWCPHSTCGQAIESITIPRAPGYFLMCTCGTRMCFRCSGAPHWPAPCRTVDWNLTRFREEADEDSNAVEKWLRANTKQCPKCAVNIEKRGGCNHMHCHHCDHDFCWVCLANFTGSHYSCTAKLKVRSGEKKTRIGGIMFNFKYDLSLPFTFFLNSLKGVRKALALRYGPYYRSGEVPNRFSNDQVREAAVSVLDHVMLACTIAKSVGFLGRHVKHQTLRGYKRLKAPLVRLTEFAWILLDLLHNCGKAEEFVRTGMAYVSAVIQVIRDLNVEVKHMTPFWRVLFDPVAAEEQAEKQRSNRVEERAVRISVHHLERPQLPVLPGFMHKEKESLLQWAASKWGLSDDERPRVIFSKGGAEIEDTSEVLHDEDLYLSTSNIFMFPQEEYNVPGSVFDQDSDGLSTESDEGTTGEEEIVLGIPRKKFLRHERAIVSLARLFPHHPLRLLCAVLSECRFDVDRAIDRMVVAHSEEVDTAVRAEEDKEMVSVCFEANEQKALVLMDMFPDAPTDLVIQSLQRTAYDEANAAAVIGEQLASARPADESATSSALPPSDASTSLSPLSSKQPAVVQSLNLRYAAKVQQVQAHVPEATFHHAQTMLQKCGGDIELAVVQLLDELAPEEEHVTERQFLTSSVMDEEEFSDYDQEEDGLYLSENEWY
eukprot:TRINITY_DN3414_c0_g1_i1.p1 TRINITY_DN3414_c0_g1~~TRINITY_DN3414_c0_g1_i1.p1  ORF type:complete len:1152 (+),score=321.53 TRINITY_DN3414_c0_g1_i1:239-3694(+)